VTEVAEPLEWVRPDERANGLRPAVLYALGPVLRPAAAGSTVPTPTFRCWLDDAGIEDARVATFSARFHSP
jgi:hypothetical protein